jgi:hypothetical protein
MGAPGRRGYRGGVIAGQDIGGAAPRRASLRGLRGAVVGTTATTLAATGHAMGGGAVPGPAQLLVVGAGAVVVAVALSSRRWSLPSLLLVVLGVQAAYHVAFATGAGVQSTGPTGPMGHPGFMAGMDHHGTPGLAMMAGHVLAAVATAALLARGEQWCLALVALLGASLVAALWRPVPVRTHRPGAAVRREERPRALLLARTVSRRGPPSGCSA